MIGVWENYLDYGEVPRNFFIFNVKCFKELNKHIIHPPAWAKVNTILKCYDASCPCSYAKYIMYVTLTGIGMRMV